MPWNTRETEHLSPLKVKISHTFRHEPIDLLNSFCIKLSCMMSLIPGELAHALRYLASVVSQSFMAFGDILELHKKFLELSGGINRIFELDEFLEASQSGTKSIYIYICSHFLL